MYSFLAAVRPSPVAFGDELQLDYDPSTGDLRVSVFRGCHWQDEAIIHIPALFADAPEPEQ